MPRDARFRRNLAIIGLAHVALLLALARWSSNTKTKPPPSIIWMDGGAGEAAPAPREASPKSPEIAAPALATPFPESPESAPAPDAAQDDQPVLASVKSEIELPPPAPRPTPTATPTSTSKTTRTPAPKAPPKVTPKPRPKASQKPAVPPKRRPKETVVAKASPSASPASSASVAGQKAETKRQPGATPGDALEKPAGKTEAAEKQSGGGGQGSGAGGASPAGWYGRMLHDRFYSEWVQPTSALASGAKMSALVKIRIEKDGRVSSFTIVKPSGNVVVDESVAAVARRVTQVDPVPGGLGGEHYDVNINFELNTEE